jgi:hypothetical protein
MPQGGPAGSECWGSSGGRISARGVQKHHTNILQKVHVGNSPQKIDKDFDVSFSLTFCFIVISGVSQRWEFKGTTKKRSAKKCCRNAFTKKSTKNPKPIFFSVLFITFLGVSRYGEGKNTIKEYKKKKSDPGPFLFLAAPCQQIRGVPL